MFSYKSDRVIWSLIKLLVKAFKSKTNKMISLIGTSVRACCLLSLCSATIMANLNITLIGESLAVGTRPHWDERTQSLYYVDVPMSYIYKYNPSTGKTTKAKVGNEPLGFMFPVDNATDKFVAGLGRKFVIVTWDGSSSEVASVEKIAEVDTEQDLKGNRVNAGKVNPDGVLWAGTMGPTDENGVTAPGKGSLYSLQSRTVKKHLSGIGISNGLAWNQDMTKMYYIDTLFPGIYQFDYNRNNNSISNRKVIYEFKKNNISGLPDGLTIDTEGMLWATSIHGGKVIRINPNTGELLQTIPFPTPQVTAVTFGGKNLDILYVTTAKLKVEGQTPGYPAGCTYAVTGLGVKGYPGDNFKL